MTMQEIDIKLKYLILFKLPTVKLPELKLFPTIASYTDVNP